ncbi:MAG: c-type cytochrome [Acidiferrobacterales bacterium]|nr:c-type cytochrome [Acidiferrobacterales bacterium]
MPTSKTLLSVCLLGCLVWAQSSVFAKDFIGGNFQLKDPLDTTDFYCFDIFGFGVNLELNETISARTCKNPGWPDTAFRVDYPNQGQIYAIDLDLCVQAISLARGAHIKLQECSDSNLQRFIYAEDETVRLRNEDNTRELCLVVNPSAGVPMDGAGRHLRREVFMYECGRVDAKHAQWVIPEGSQYSPPMAAESELTKATPASPLIAGQFEYVGACSRCHGANGEGIEGMQAPRLAGMPAPYVKAQFVQFLEGIRGSEQDGRWAAQMTYYIKTLSERHMAAMDDIVAYIEALPEPEIEQTVFADDQKGSQIYSQQCAVCHGTDGLGIVALKSSRLAGLQDWYLIKQMYKYRDGRRGAQREDRVGVQMVAVAKALSEDDIENVISYLNQL